MKAIVHITLLLCVLVNTSGGALGQGIQSKPKLFAPNVVSTEYMETSASFTPDGRTVYFTRSDMQFSDNTILESHLVDGRWGTPKVASFSGVWRDSEPHVSPDGSKLFFVSNRPVSGNKPLTATLRGITFPGANIWYVTRKGGRWTEPRHIDGPVSAVPMVYNPSVARNGTLYFSGVLPDGEGKNQIYRSIPVKGVYGPPERLSFSDPQWNHMDPSIDPNERFIVFAANRPGGMGTPADLYICFKKEGEWGEPINLGANVNSTALENAPCLAPDGKTLYFTSMRPPFIAFPKTKENYRAVLKRLRRPENGTRNIWQVDLSPLLGNLN